MRRRDPSTVPDDSVYWRELSHAGWLALAEKQQARFWSKIDRTGSCWLWTPKRVDKDGYGRFAVTGRGARYRGDKPRQKHMRAHRLAWELTRGKTVPDGLLLMHECDNPRCCNPSHLTPGTQKENIGQAKARGRNVRRETHGDWLKESRPRGVRHGRASINDEQARQIRELAKTGIPKAQVAKRLGISAAVVYQLLAGKTWRHTA